MKYIIYLTIFLFFFQLTDCMETDRDKHVFAPVIKKLIARGADSAFVYRLVNMNGVQFDEKYVRINVIGYIQKADYSKHYDETSVGKTANFLADNLSVLDSAEKKYDVPKEVIASILWIETRHGSYIGNHNIVSVFLSTALANEKEFLLKNKLELVKSFKGSKTELAELKEKLKARSKKKAAWALGELLALEKLNKISPVPIHEINGSWAGAFGISQFLPSSYIRWAVDGDGDGQVNLFEIKDAIFSVANYLKANGWGNIPEKRRKAVFHYNNSTDYVDAVLTLATKIGHDIDFMEKADEHHDISEPLSKQLKREAAN